MKIGKLAINDNLSKEIVKKGYGSFALDYITTIAIEENEIGIACRFLTVDADIEYCETTTDFYEKNGFEYNESNYKKKDSKTISMRKDIYGNN